MSAHAMTIHEVGEGHDPVVYPTTLRDLRPDGTPGVPIPLASITELRLRRLYREALPDADDVSLVAGTEDLVLIQSGIIQPVLSGIAYPADGALEVSWPGSMFTILDRCNHTELLIALFRLEHTGGVDHWEAGFKVHRVRGLGA